MPVHRCVLAFGVAQAALVVLALGGDAGVLPDPLPLLTPAAVWLLFAGTPALAFLAPHAVTRAERVLVTVLVAASGLVAGVGFRVVAAARATHVDELAGAVLGILITFFLLDRLRRADVLGNLAPVARAGFVITGAVTAFVGGVPVVGAASLVAALFLVVARVAAVDARKRVPGAVAAGFAANPLVAGLPLAAAGVALERAGSAVRWPTALALIVIVALLVSALAPGLVLLLAARRQRAIAGA